MRLASKTRIRDGLVNERERGQLWALSAGTAGPSTQYLSQMAWQNQLAALPKQSLLPIASHPTDAIILKTQSSRLIRMFQPSKLGDMSIYGHLCHGQNYCNIVRA